MTMQANDTEPAGRGGSWGLLMLIAGGAVTILGSFLAWARLNVAAGGLGLGLGLGGGSGVGRAGRGGLLGRLGALARSSVAVTTRGTDLPDGRLVLGLGIALLVVALVAWSARSSGGQVALAAVGVVLGTVITTITVSLSVIGASRSQLGAILSRFVSERPGIGLYLAIAGGVIAMVGGASGMWAMRAWWSPDALPRPGTTKVPPPPGEEVAA